MNFQYSLVFSVIWSFRNYSNSSINNLNNISFIIIINDKNSCAITFFVEINGFFSRILWSWKFQKNSIYNHFCKIAKLLSHLIKLTHLCWKRILICGRKVYITILLMQLITLKCVTSSKLVYQTCPHMAIVLLLKGYKLNEITQLPRDLRRTKYVSQNKSSEISGPPVLFWTIQPGPLLAKWVP